MTNARLEELRAKFQENPRRYFAPFANELRKSGDSAQAISICRAHLATQPGHVSGHIVLGQALYEAGSTDESRDVFTAALELDPENLIALRSLGEIAQVRGQFGAARQWYQRLLDADPRNNEVAQLLRDLPSESTFAPPPVAAPPRAADEPTPLSIRNEVEAAEPEPPVPAPSHTIHTGFTGSGPAYDPDRPRNDAAPESRVEPEAAPEPVAARFDEPPPAVEDAVDEPFIDLQVSAHDDHHQAPSYSEPAVATPEASTEPPPAMAMTDVDAFDQPPVAAAQPDEDAATADVAEREESRFGPPIPEAAGEDEFGAMPEAPAASYTPNESTSTEPPRAVFAEHGFDGPADGDEVGWLTTPSAAYSDLEAAPEDWFDVPAAAGAEASVAMPSEAESAPADPPVEDPATDSWFDDVGGATAIEPTDLSSDELWLPPELPQVTAAEDNTRRTAETQPEGEPAVAESADTHRVTEIEHAPPAIAATGDSESEPPVAFAEPAEEEWQPPASEYAAQEMVRSPRESVEAEWAPEEPVSSESRPSMPDESFETHAVAEEAEGASFESHPAWEAQPESTTDADTGEPALPVYSASSEHETTKPTDAAAPQPATPAPDPFITETLAELYLKQGFRDEALSIYRQLLNREPANAALRDRIESLERGAEPVAAGEPDQARVASQSVRTFFSRLARRQATTPSPRKEPDVPFAAAASALANMFEASRPNPTDENAASTLSAAFTDPSGRPSRAAERELSLDHLFREVAPRESQGGAGGLTLDEFYSTPNAATGSTTEPDATPDESTGSDIRQFTAWLEGLRKK